jgi:hypothetical protein
MNMRRRVGEKALKLARRQAQPLVPLHGLANGAVEADIVGHIKRFARHRRARHRTVESRCGIRFTHFHVGDEKINQGGTKPASHPRSGKGAQRRYGHKQPSANG